MSASLRRCWWLSPLLLAGCLGTTPERARIEAVRYLPGPGPMLEADQDLRLSDTMFRALAHGIPLRLGYWVNGCAPDPVPIAVHTIELRYAPLRRAYELVQDGRPVRRFARRSALLAALDRVRIPLPTNLPADCQGDVGLVLDLTSLPTPLRFPAFLQPSEWRLVSPRVPWQAAPG